jgi:hypothetical protein
MTDIVSSFARSLQLIRASGKVLRSDPELLILPVISGIATVIVGAALVWPAFAAGIFPPLEDGEPVGPLSPAFYVWLFVFYFVEYFVIIFFNTALIGAAIARLEGGNPTVGSAIALAWSRILPIIGYAFVSATFGLLLRMVAEKLGFLGRLIEFGAGLAWTVATFLVVPVLAVEGVGPLRGRCWGGESDRTEPHAPQRDLGREPDRQRWHLGHHRADRRRGCTCLWRWHLSLRDGPSGRWHPAWHGRRAGVHRGHRDQQRACLDLFRRGLLLRLHWQRTIRFRPRPDPRLVLPQGTEGLARTVALPARTR